MTENSLYFFKFLFPLISFKEKKNLLCFYGYTKPLVLCVREHTHINVTGFN